MTAAAVAWLQPAPVVTYDSYGGGRYDPAPGSNTGLAIGFGEVSGSVAGWCVGAIFRAEYRARATKDVLDALVENHFGHAFDPGRTYAISMRESGFKAEGLRAGKALAWQLSGGWTLTAAGSLSLLRGLLVQEQWAQGSAVATSDSYATGTATWIRDQSNLNLSQLNPFVPHGNPSGWGYSSDFEIRADSSAGWGADFTVIDAYGRMHWHDVPQTVKTLQNATVTYNENLDQSAAITGFDSRVRLEQRLPLIYHLLLKSASWCHLSVFAEDDATDGLHFPSLGTRIGSAHRYAQVDYDTRTGAVGVSYQNSFFQLGGVSNRLALRDATVLGLQLRLFHAW